MLKTQFTTELTNIRMVQEMVYQRKADNSAATTILYNRNVALFCLEYFTLLKSSCQI